MPETKEQKDTIKRVMHEYKHDELESGSGKPVKSRKQAIAIALHEAGVSRNDTGSQGKARTRARPTKARKPNAEEN
jgi:hypothetical protein